MDGKTKIRLGWLAFIFVLFHFGMIIIFAMPNQLKPNQSERYVSWYVGSFFHQKWALFAPCPVIDGEIWVNFEFEGERNGYILPKSDANEIHRKLRFTHHGDLVLGDANLIYYLYNDFYMANLLTSDSLFFETLPFHTYGTNKLRTYVDGYGRLIFNKEPTQAGVQLKFRNVQSNKENSIVIDNLYAYE